MNSTNKNKIAIVIPYYKISFFDDVLKSLTSQTDKRFKIYIGDDSSPENPKELLERYKESLDFVYHKFEKNLGSISLTQQWERCIALSNDEDWVLILGDDDILSKNVIESFYEKINAVENEGINVIRFATQKINTEGKIISNIYNHPEIEKSTDFLFRRSRSSLSEYVFKKNQIHTIGFKDFPLGWYSDILAVLEFSNFEYVYSINQSIVQVRVSSLSISGSSLYDKQKDTATFYFYFYLLNNKFASFSQSELDELYCKINKCYLNNKKRYGFFLKISKFYIVKKLFREYFLFIKQIILFTIRSIKS
ncbi:glycosyltransferase family 2 protein [Flavobacterium hungaricum]|uniref:Glycosyltransferase n=1 Tax=Flavobacterium hungaricum TaxID=2082725 RepID=A0ABR9TSL1_9FLAO|nr:glycosyltransferase family 2 protein [Flavobacterium hungaricum]MBE8727779.1 glycosyltransferase [Flavobacterium hungaricum]